MERDDNGWADFREYTPTDLAEALTTVGAGLGVVSVEVQDADGKVVAEDLVQLRVDLDNDLDRSGAYAWVRITARAEPTRESAWAKRPIQIHEASVRVTRVERQRQTANSVLFWIGMDVKHTEVTSGGATVSLRSIAQPHEPRPLPTHVTLPVGPGWNMIAEPQRYGVYVYCWLHGDAEELELEWT